MTRIGLIGGTFDPPHNGHLALAQAALASGRIDRLIIMPAGQPPHKPSTAVSMAGYRYEMARQAFDDLDYTEVSTFEILREGPSYTVHTISQILDAAQPGDELVLIYGSDILFDIEKWYHPQDILLACPLLLAVRGGYAGEPVIKRANELRARYDARIEFFPAAEIELSSSQIREMIALRQPISGTVPEKVARLIHKHGFYARQSIMAEISSSLAARLASLERDVWPLLDRKRLLHSLNVMLYALHLADVHGVDPVQAGTAALLHDCAKCLPRHECQEYARLAGDDSLLGSELAHGPAGAWLARTRFGVDDPAVLRAIHYHTTGSAGMTKLDKIIFIADKVEPARTYENLEEIRRLVEFDLDAALNICLSEIDLFLQREKLEPHPYTGHARSELDKRLSNRDS